MKIKECEREREKPQEKVVGGKKFVYFTLCVEKKKKTQQIVLWCAYSNMWKKKKHDRDDGSLHYIYLSENLFALSDYEFFIEKKFFW